MYEYPWVILFDVLGVVARAAISANYAKLIFDDLIKM